MHCIFLNSISPLSRCRMHLYMVLISCLVSSSHCWQFDGGGQRRARNAARGPPPTGGRGSAALLGSQQQDILYACPLNSMCQCAGLPNETSTLIEINCNQVALYKFPGKRPRLYSPICRPHVSPVNMSPQLVTPYLCGKYFHCQWVINRLDHRAGHNAHCSLAFPIPHILFSLGPCVRDASI